MAPRVRQSRAIRAALRQCRYLNNLKRMAVVDAVHQHITVHANRILRLENRELVLTIFFGKQSEMKNRPFRLSHLSARVDELAHVVASVVIQVVQIGVLDRRLVRRRPVVLHEAHRYRRLACAHWSRTWTRSIDRSVDRTPERQTQPTSTKETPKEKEKEKEKKCSSAPTARKPKIAKRRFNGFAPRDMRQKNSFFGVFFFFFRHFRLSRS